MKKKMIALLAGALMTLSASSAFAYFSGTELYMAAYDTTANKEVVIDLGSLVKAADGSYSLTSSGVNSFNLATDMAGATAANTMVAFFGYDGTNRNMFASASSTNTPTNQASQMSNFTGKINFIASNYNAASALGTGSASATNSYYSQMSSQVPGSFGGLNGPAAINWATPEMSLATLAAGGNLGIYSFAYTSKASNAVAGVLQLTETLVADTNGNYTVTATPIPAAFYLLGSGLMGLVGLRRKFQG